MLICKLSDQLGNQMFAYAAIKSIAKDKDYTFGVLSEYDNQFLKNDTDTKFGCTLSTIFKNIQKEIITEIPPHYKIYQENRKGNSSLQKEVIEIADNTVMKGHYISPLYFMHRLNEVQEWFQLPQEVEKVATKKLNKIKGYMLSKHYWKNAARELLNQTNEDIIFICFYDKMSGIISDFKNRYPSIVSHNSLLEDFCMISKCDYHIVCNSSYSVMAALMDRKSINTTYCPSIWPIPKKLYPTDTYPEQWKKVKAKRNVYSYLMGYIAPYLSPLKYLVKKRK